MSHSKSFFVYNADVPILQPGFLCAVPEKPGKDRRRKEKKKGKERQGLITEYFLSALVGVELQ